MPAVGSLYQHHPANQSLWTLGQRLFVGVPEVALAPLPPPQPRVALVLAGPPLLAALLLAVWTTRPPFRPAWALAVLVCASILVSPLAWPYSVTLAALPTALVISFAGWPIAPGPAARRPWRSPSAGCCSCHTPSSAGKLIRYSP